MEVVMQAIMYGFLVVIWGALGLIALYYVLDLIVAWFKRLSLRFKQWNRRRRAFRNIDRMARGKWTGIAK